MPAGYACGLRSADCDGSLRLRGRNPSKPSRVHRSARPVRCGPSDLSHFRRGETFEQDLRKNGPLYALMIWTWNCVFTPVVALGLVGFVTLLISTGNSLLLTGALLLLIGVGIWYLLLSAETWNRRMSG